MDIKFDTTIVYGVQMGPLAKKNVFHNFLIQVRPVFFLIVPKKFLYKTEFGRLHGKN